MNEGTKRILLSAAGAGLAWFVFYRATRDGKPLGYMDMYRVSRDGEAHKFPGKIDEYERLLTKNRIWIKRQKGVGVVSREQAIALGLSGPVARGSGVDWDIRRDEPYEAYDEVEFKVPVKTDGDAYSRYLVRIEEMRQSVHIIRQLINKIPDGPYTVSYTHLTLPTN